MESLHGKEKRSNCKGGSDELPRSPPSTRPFPFTRETDVPRQQRSGVVAEHYPSGLLWPPLDSNAAD